MSHAEVGFLSGLTPHIHGLRIQLRRGTCMPDDGTGVSFPTTAEAAATTTEAPPGRSYDTTEQPPAGRLRRRLRWVLLAAGATVALVGAGFYGNYYWTVGRFLVSTDDAYLQADNVIISPKVSGYISDVLVEDNQAVKGRQVKRTQASQVVKQADVVALLGLLPAEFAGEAAAKNFRYYEPRCSHGSSLSPAMHGLVAARLGDTEMALRFFRQTAAIDLTDTKVAADGGIHIAALGRIWMLAVFGFAGIVAARRPHSHRPSTTSRLAQIDLQGAVVWLAPQNQHRPGKQTVEATLEAGNPMTLTVGAEPTQLSSPATLVASIRRLGGPAR
jgi:Glycosyl hydrolase family 65 central catalytic domain